MSSGQPLRALGVALSFGGQRVLELPELALRPGTLTVLSGPSGSGKSSLLYILSGLLSPDTGSVLWSETDLAALPEAKRDGWRREHAGFIFQNFHLIDELSPLDNVIVPRWFSSFSAADARPLARRLLDDLGVPLARDRVSLLSRGEQQRVAIARALIGEPGVLFADEPTASLDRKAGIAVSQILRQQAHAHGRTVIAASHDPDLVDLADIVVTLNHGQPAAITDRQAAA